LALFKENYLCAGMYSGMM